MREDRIVIVDPMGEYSPLVRRLGGQVIEIAPDSPHHINPMDIQMGLNDEDRLKLVYGGEYPSSIIDAEYTDIDDGGVPWTVVVLIDQEAFAENYLVSMVFSTVWPATYLGKYQLFCGVPGDEWAVHVTVKDADSGEVISEHDFPTRDE